jgi:hypothetical protein
VFDQTWAVADPKLIADETYQWTVDGVQTELVVSGLSLVRTRGPARNPVVTLVTTAAVLWALAAGETIAANAVATGDLVLTRPDDAITPHVRRDRVAGRHMTTTGVRSRLPTAL